MASATTTTAPEEAEAMEEYESDPEEVKRSLVMRRREASDDEEEGGESEDKGNRRRMDRRPSIHSDDESDGQGGAPAEYDNEQEEYDGELEDEEEEEEEEDIYERAEEVYEEEDGKEDRNDGEVRVKGTDGNDVGRSTEAAVELNPGYDDNDNEKDGVDGMEEGKKESTEPFAVPTAGTFYMHDDRFRDNVGGRHRRTHGGRKLWELKDDRKWGHDKFEEMTLRERHYDGGRRNSRGRYRDRGKNRGPEYGYPRGSRPKAFNNSNNNYPKQAPKGVRGRGPKKYEPAWKNSNQASPSQNRHSGKPLDKTSHTNSGRAFTPASISESDTVPIRKQVFASSLSSASPPFYPSGSSNKDITLMHKRDVQSGSTSRNLQTSGVDESSSVQHANAMKRGKNIADIGVDKLYIDDSGVSAAVKPLNSLQMQPSAQTRAQGRGVAIPQQIAYQPTPSQNQATNRVSPPTQLQAVQQSPGQSRTQPFAESLSQQLGQHSASGYQASSPPKAASATISYDSSEVESPLESSKSKGALVGKVKGSQGRGSFMYGDAHVMGDGGNMTVGHGDQNFPVFLPVMQFGRQHTGGIGVPAVGMAFPGYVAQPQHGLGNSEMTWLPVLAGAAGALGATYCPPYQARPAVHTSAMGSSSKENNTNKPSNEWKSSQRTEAGSDEFGQQQNKPQPRRYSAMNLANDVLR